MAHGLVFSALWGAPSIPTSTPHGLVLGHLAGALAQKQVSPERLRVGSHTSSVCFGNSRCWQFCPEILLFAKEPVTDQRRAGFSVVEGKLWPAHVYLPVLFQRTKGLLIFLAPHGSQTNPGLWDPAVIVGEHPGCRATQRPPRLLPGQSVVGASAPGLLQVLRELVVGESGGGPAQPSGQGATS